ncbi:MAG: AMP-binding protein, partial [bacterium]
MATPAAAGLEFAPPGVEVEPRQDGGMVLRSPYPLDAYPASVPAMLHRWEAEAPARVWMAERPAPPVTDAPWRKLGYGEAGDAVRRLGQAFLDRGVSPERPVMLLSDNAIDHALVQLAAMQAGVPAAPVSPAYSLMSRDHDRLRNIFDQLTPGLVYAADGARFEAAFRALALGDTPVAVSANPADGRHELLSELMRTQPGAAIRDAFARVGPDTIAKILFTS